MHSRGPLEVLRDIFVVTISSAERRDVFRDDQFAREGELLPVSGLEVAKQIANRFLSSQSSRDEQEDRHKL